MPDVKTTHLAYPASHERFPSEQLRELYPAGPPSLDSQYQENVVNPRTPIHPFIQNWTSPEWFHSDGRNQKDLPKVQWDFSKHPIGRKRRILNDERKEAVKRAFAYSWQKYKDHAWGHDEVKPVTAVPSDPFQGWGATIIDSLETLLIMGLQAEYELCREHVNKVDFRLISGADWARGWRADLADPRQSDDESEEFDFKKRGHLDEYVYQDEQSERPWRESHQLMATFETGIRYLGGLIGAYDLSGDPIVLERAKELGKILGRGFDTPSGLVMGRFDAGSKSDYFHNGRVSLAEVGSMNLELTRLSQVTGDRWYFDQAQRAIDYIENIVIPASDLAPLVPSMFDSNVATRINGYYSFGAMADSYYEYLIKQHQLIGGATNQFAHMYAQAVDKAQELMFANLTYYPGRDLMTISGYNHPGRGLAYELEHLTCFAGGMLGLGSRLLDRPQDLVSGSAFTQTCYHLSAATASGLQPEKVNFFDTHMPDSILYENITAIIEDEEDEYITVTKLKGTPQGTVNVDGRYLGRPETAESVFYMFVAVFRVFWKWHFSLRIYSIGTDSPEIPNGRIEGGECLLLGLRNVQRGLAYLASEMFVKRNRDTQTIWNREPGVDKLWTPPASAINAELGKRGSGTDAQLYTRLQRIAEVDKQRQIAPPGSKGFMGGGLGMSRGGNVEKPAQSTEPHQEQET
ncbi:hypothetical protein QFC21_002283 [Naganishia friedmannii]|uniref:Uncharacterized protein n=1 Tax=Naganishia friedmannii TaxID=89922 RepID=A0ACC2VXH7_9TREE|nr:hypothetical protein QFC21_002283 [Naganishia friedmannii]